MRRMLLTCFCLLLACSPALAGKTVTVTPLDQPVQSIQQTAPAAPACQVGNLNAPAWAITDWVWGAETYKYLFDADQAACTCLEGFKVTQIHFYMQFGAEDVPVSFDCFVDFEEAVYDPAMGCFLPGPVICQSPTYTVTIDNAGLYDLALPIPVENCPCAYFGYKYALGITILSTFASSPDVITDANPVGCTSWNDYGMGWYDLLSFGFPGELIMFADIGCCSGPVDSESQSWGGVKSLFR